MNFYGPVPCVSALSLSLPAALPLKDNHARQFVPRSPAEWASGEVKYQGEHTHTHTKHTHTLSFSLTPLHPVVLDDLWPVHYPFQGDKCLWLFSEGEARMAALGAAIVFREVSQML